MAEEFSSAHVLIFPFPVQGHVNSMLKLAEILCLAGLNVTFLNSEYNHDRLIRFTDIEARFSKYPGFQFKTIFDGVPEDHHRTGDWVEDLFNGIEARTRFIFKEMIIEYTPRIDCIIGDGCMLFVLEVANEVGVPIIHFRTISACSFWSYFCIPDMIEAGELPIKGKEDMDSLITKVPGMENFLRCRDLPSFCRSRVSDMEDGAIMMVTKATRQSPRAQALILNTFEDLEAPILSQIRAHCPNTYTIGPLHLHLEVKLGKSSQKHQSCNNSLFEVDRSCITWLDNQPLKSVLYVSFGSVAVITRDQLMEFWYGLVNSKKRFLWVMRADSVIKKDDNPENIPEELLKGSQERGFIVGWAPQEEVLAHKAVGGFLTHSGWNSTLESITAGVPMICWPYFADQQVNSRFVGEVWRLGLDMKDVCEREIVEKMVNDLMVEKKEEYERSSARMAELARMSVRNGGSSCHNLDCLIEYIKLMGTQAHDKVENA